MFIVSKRNIVIPGGKGREPYFIRKDYAGPVPDWLAESAYFQALVRDEKITVSGSGGKEKASASNKKNPRQPRNSPKNTGKSKPRDEPGEEPPSLTPPVPREESESYGESGGEI